MVSDEQQIGLRKMEVCLNYLNAVYHLGEMIEIVQWMSGSDDFSENGQAHAGWSKAREKMKDAMNFYKEVTDEDAIDFLAGEVKKKDDEILRLQSSNRFLMDRCAVLIQGRYELFEKIREHDPDFFSSLFKEGL